MLIIGEDVKFIEAGDIGAAVSLKEVNTGDTLCAVEDPVVLVSDSRP